MQSATPKVFLPQVWPLPLSLAATQEIDVSFSSYGYLDVSVPRVPLLQLCIYCKIHAHYHMWVSPFGNLRVRICASNRSLSQLITSFVGSQCQGIHPMLFLTWPFKSSTLALKSFLFTMLILSVNSGFSQQIDFWNRYPYSCLLPGDRLVLDSLSICLLLVLYHVIQFSKYILFLNIFSSALSLQILSSVAYFSMLLRPHSRSSPSRKILCKHILALSGDGGE